MTYTKSSRLSKAISGAILIGIAGTVGATGLSINVSHGLQISIQAAIVFGAIDLTKIILPIVCGLIGWNRQLKLVALVCVAASLFFAFEAYHSKASQVEANKQHGAGQYDLAMKTVAEAQARVAELDAKATAEAANGGCGKICKAYQADAEKARQRLSEARTALKAAEPVALDAYAKHKATVTAVIFLLAIETLVWLSIPGMTALSQAFAPAPKKAVIRKSRKAAKPKRRTEPMVKKIIGDAYKDLPYKRTVSGKLDGRTREARKLKQAATV